MAASDYDFLLTRNEIIQQAYKKLGVLVDGETMSAEMIDTGEKRLNLIVKSYQTDGIFLWQEFTETQPLSVGIDQYDFPSDPPAHWIRKAYYRANDVDLPLEYLSWREYQDVYDKTVRGTPTHFTVDHRNSMIVLWPVPSAAETLVEHCISKLKDFDDADSTGDFSAKWQRALMYELTLDLADDFPVAASVYNNIKTMAKELYMSARGSERDNSGSDHVKGAYE